MVPDWETLFAPRPLAARAMRLELEGLSEAVWFAAAAATDLRAAGQECPAHGSALAPGEFLTAAELTRASEFKFGQPRENFRLGRLAAKLVLSGATCASGPLTPALSPGGGEGEDFARRLRSFEIGNGERGEPVVCAGGLQPPLPGVTNAPDGGCKPPAPGVSLSHVNACGVAVAFPAGVRLGLDFELIDPRRAETVRKAVPLSAEEEAWLKVTPLSEATALLLLWTAREALGKALGCGLACQWETLALREITTTGSARFAGNFLHHPQFRCWSWVGPGAVMSLACAASHAVRGQDAR